MRSATLLPPGPGLPALLGEAVRLRGDPLRLMLRLSRRYGDAAGLRLAGRPLVAGFGPAYFRAALLERPESFARFHRPSARLLYPDDLERLDGARHHEARQRLAPAYTREHVAGYVEPLAALVERSLDGWRVGAVVDLGDWLAELLLLLLARVMLGVDLGGDLGRVRRAVVAIRRRTSTPLGALLELVPPRLPGSTYGRRREHVYRLERLFEEAVAGGPVDGRNAVLPAALARTHAVVSLPGAAGVTAAATTWAFYLLAQHPAAARQLLAEVGGQGGGRLGDVEELASLRYLDLVVRESLRLYATVGVIPRVALEPVAVDGYTLPAGTILGLTPYVLHRRPELHPRPFEFRPERFDPERNRRLPACSYLPFGAGYHTCIGQHLAVLLIKLVLVATLRRYSLQLIPGQRMEERFTATQEIGLRLLARVLPRDGARPGARTHIVGDAVGAEPGPRAW